MWILQSAFRHAQRCGSLIIFLIGFLIMLMPIFQYRNLTSTAIKYNVFSAVPTCYCNNLPRHIMHSMHWNML